MGVCGKMDKDGHYQRTKKKIDLEPYGGYATVCPAFATVCDGSMQCSYTRLRIIMGYITPLSGGSTAHSLTAVACTRVPYRAVQVGGVFLLP